MSDPSSSQETNGEDQRLDELGRRYRIEVIKEVPDEWLDPALAKELPVKWARENFILPVRKEGKLFVLTAEPGSINAQKHLSLLLGCELTPLLAAKGLIANCIERCYFSKQESAQDFLRDMDIAHSEQLPVRDDDLLQAAEDAPVTQLTNLILLEAVKSGASDIHIEPFSSKLKIRYRIDGLLYEQVSPPKHLGTALTSRLKVMARLDIAEKRLAQDGVARVRIGEREMDVRVSTVPVAEGERVVLRLLDRSSALLPLSGLGIPDEMMEAMRHATRASHGIMIVCGPTGSGKTTTLYAVLQQLDKARTNIMTIEDPIEYQLPDIGQIQVRPKIGLTFANGLRHVLRQDPDTILVGEIRDLETAEIAIRASLTGHLVFSTLHTNDAPEAVIRLMDMGVEPYLLAASLRLVLAQRLVRKICHRCGVKAEFEPGSGLPAAANELLAGKSVWQARGCSECLEGYSGRTGLFEMMLIDAELAELIRSGRADSASIRSFAKTKGMRSMLEHGIERALAGETSLSEALRAAGSVELSSESATRKLSE